MLSVSSSLVVACDEMTPRNTGAEQSVLVSVEFYSYTIIMHRYDKISVGI